MHKIIKFVINVLHCVKLVNIITIIVHLVLFNKIKFYAIILVFVRLSIMKIQLRITVNCVIINVRLVKLIKIIV